VLSVLLRSAEEHRLPARHRTHASPKNAHAIPATLSPILLRNVIVRQNRRLQVRMLQLQQIA